MREIKFRAWDGRNMINSQLFSISMNGKLIFNSGECGNRSYDFPIMQCTGWKDRKLVEIFDGDIVKSSIGSEEDIFAIDLNKLDWFISPKGHSFDNGSISFEVIGNIYENKDLL